MQAVEGQEVEVPLFASSTSSPMRRRVKKSEQVDNHDGYVDGDHKPAVSTHLPNQTSSASNIKPSVIKVEVRIPLNDVLVLLLPNIRPLMYLAICFLFPSSPGVQSEFIVTIGHR